jgi:Ni/Fe-hydrogenase subunit HybB-like protein
MRDPRTHERALLPWQRGVHVYDVPFFSIPFLVFLVLTIIGLGLSVLRAFGGLGFTGMSDAYAWGIWKTFNVMTLTALGSGGFAIGLAAWVFKWERLHLVMRTALLTSFVFYLAGLLALTVDVGRPWNMWHLLFPSHWNPESSLLEVAVCMPLYALIFLAFENLPPLWERLYVHASDGIRQWMKRAFPALKVIYPFVVAGAYVLPAMHQSSLGALLLLSGEKLHPLWQSQLLPLLYVIQAGVAGTACVMVTLMAGCLVWRRRLDLTTLGDLGRLMGYISLGFLALRWGDVILRGQLGAAFAFDAFSLLFHVENLMVLVPTLFMLRPAQRRRPRVLFLSAVTAMLGAMAYRFVPTTIAFVPGELKMYFPSALEVLMSAGYVSLTIVLYTAAVKLFAIVPASLEEWYEAVAWARQNFRTIRVDSHGKATRH